MIAVTFLSEDGTSQVRSAALGTTLMRIAVQSGVQGILAECGGACACATCHVIVDASWVAAAGRRTIWKTRCLTTQSTVSPALALPVRSS